MSIVTQCRHPGCRILTIGDTCVEHDDVVEVRAFTRGRPHFRAVATVTRATAPPTLLPARAGRAVALRADGDAARR